MPTRHFTADRRGAVALMFALGAIPVIGLVGAAVDFGIWNQTNATMSVAANVAAMTAVKIAANAQLAVDPNAQIEGQQAGAKWFAAEVGANGRIGTEGVTAQSVTVTVGLGATVTAQVSYSGQVPSVFGGLFGVGQYPVNGLATAQVTAAPYLDIEMVLDNSSSMDIGATPADMAHLQQISACDPSNVTYDDGNQESLDKYVQSYGYKYAGREYDGPLRSPYVPGPPVVLTGGSQGSISLPQFTPPRCLGFANVYQSSTATYATAGPPCEFACHWDKTHNSGLAQDLYGAARKTLLTANPITLRFDLVKAATNTVIGAMQGDDLSIRNLRVGVFTFNTRINQVYPTSGEAADNWTGALAAVGPVVTSPTQEETGILPVVGQRTGPNDDTDVVDSLASLRRNYLTSSSGDGTKPQAPRKVMFLVTDGFMDDNLRGRSAFPSNPSVCEAFQKAGYTVYVVFTPYYGVMHQSYLSNNWSAVVYGPAGGGPNGTAWTNTPGTLAYALQQCASAPGDYISATDGPTLTAALTTFLKQALNQPARFTN